MPRLIIVLVVLAATGSWAVRTKTGDGALDENIIPNKCMCEVSGTGAGRGIMMNHALREQNILDAVEVVNGVSKLATFKCLRFKKKECKDCVFEGKQPCCAVMKGEEGKPDTPVECGTHQLASSDYKQMSCLCTSAGGTLRKDNIFNGAGIKANADCTPEATCGQCCFGGSSKVCDGRYVEDGVSKECSKIGK